MEENKESVFRKSALNRISSPEELDRYLVVTGPGIWMTLIAVIVLLIGVFAWMILGKLDTTVDVAVYSNGKETVCLVPADKIDNVVKSGKVTIGGVEYDVRDAGYARQLITEETDINIRVAGSLPTGVYVTPLAVSAVLPEGVFDGQVVVETVNPISYIIN